MVTLSYWRWEILLSKKINKWATFAFYYFKQQTTLAALPSFSNSDCPLGWLC